MLESFKQLSLASFASFLGIVTTVLIAATNLRLTLKINKNTTYTNSVTKERIESMNSLKGNSALFNSLLYSFISSTDKIDQKELYELKTLIEYQLNDRNNTEKELAKRMNDIIWLCEVYCDERYNDSVMFERELYQRKIGPHASLIQISFKRYVFSLLKIEFRLFEAAIKSHIKNEWSKIKTEVDF